MALETIEKPNYENAVEKAHQLLKKYNIKDPVIPVFDLAKNAGLELKFIKMPQQLEKVAGFLDIEKNTIFINADDAPNRQIFTVAHELGHFILKHKEGEYGVLLRMTKIIETNPKEKEANCFAAHLLVPTSMLKEVMKKYSIKEFDTKLLANIFGVSEAVMRYRIQSLKYEQH